MIEPSDMTESMRNPLGASVRPSASTEVLRALVVDGVALALDFVWVIAFRHNVPLSLALCLATTGARFVFVRRRGDLLLFVPGGVAAAFSDALQVASGVYTYPVVQLWTIPACMVAVWGQIMLLVASVFGVARVAARPLTKRELAIVCLAYGAALASVCTLYRTPILVALVSTVAATILASVRSHRFDLHLVLVAAVLGPSAEAILVHNGVYTFSVPFVAGMPLWHPFFWAASVLFMRRTVSH